MAELHAPHQEGQPTRWFCQKINNPHTVIIFVLAYIRDKSTSLPYIAFLVAYSNRPPCPTMLQDQILPDGGTIDADVGTTAH